MVAPVIAATAEVVTLNVALFAPAATVTLAGEAALDTLEVRLTTAPPDGAGPVRVTVPVDGEPPTTDVGARVSEVSVAAVILSEAFAEELPRVAVRVAEVVVATADVVTVNVAVVVPEATVTVEGRPALIVLDVSEIAIPPVGAALPSVTVPDADVPPSTVVGATVNELTTGEAIFSVAESEIPCNVALMVAVVDDATGEVVTLNVAVVAPAATFTLGGTTAFVLVDVRVTTDPPTGAGPLRVTVPVEGAPPDTEVGEREIAVRLDAVIVRFAFAEVA